MNKVEIIDPKRSSNPLKDILMQLTPQVAQQLTTQAGTQIDIFVIGYVASSGQLEGVGTQPVEGAIKTLEIMLANMKASGRSGLIIP